MHVARDELDTASHIQNRVIFCLFFVKLSHQPFVGKGAAMARLRFGRGRFAVALQHAPLFILSNMHSVCFFLACVLKCSFVPRQLGTAELKPIFS